MDNIPNYRQRLVAFIDILGFSALIDDLADNPEIHRRVHFAFAHIKSSYQASLSIKTALSDLEISVFSDSVVITAAPEHIKAVIWGSGWLQANLLYIGILTRGGVSVGCTIHQNDILYGEGMLKAHHIESKVAVYPRIVLDKDLVSNLPNDIKSRFLDEDHDGLWFIDPFKFHAVAGYADELLADGYDPREEYFNDVGKYINEAQVKLNDMGHLAKWNWLAKRHRRASQIYLENREPQM